MRTARLLTMSQQALWPGGTWLEGCTCLGVTCRGLPAGGVPAQGEVPGQVLPLCEQND